MIFHLVPSPPTPTEPGHTHSPPCQVRRPSEGLSCSWFPVLTETVLVESLKLVPLQSASRLNFNRVCLWRLGHVGAVKAGVTFGPEISGRSFRGSVWRRNKSGAKCVCVWSGIKLHSTDTDTFFHILHTPPLWSSALLWRPGPRSPPGRRPGAPPPPPRFGSHWVKRGPVTGAAGVYSHVRPLVSSAAGREGRSPTAVSLPSTVLSS